MRIETGINNRDETLRMLMQATGEATKTGAIFCAAEHYLHDKRNKEKLIGQLDSEVVEALSTTELPMEISVETSVGKE